ncbi:glycosyltransferase family 4 protein [Desulfosoma caldarium]|uniref:Glycosyltransferase involved in cell wall biosynthesis n=1 Tax=Desulfosoma caldarium TaxID=610254 RepID=A0A3N1VMG1_9BACT|nr:glycosyltransferase [Desulfosoma caldarium]ROR03150.1 glycosyltransferase involved in cell wall biosynthesis [Desulfosoma caldarium]
MHTTAALPAGTAHDIEPFPVTPYDEQTAHRFRDTLLLLGPAPFFQDAGPVVEGLPFLAENLKNELGVPCALVLLGPSAGVPQGWVVDPSPPLVQGVSLFSRPNAAVTAALFRCAQAFLALWPTPGAVDSWIYQAMAQQVPVISGPETPGGVRQILGDAAMHLTTSDLSSLEAFLRVFLSDRLVRRQVAAAQAARLVHLGHAAPSARLDYLVDGPFDTSYSLALVNRQGARALDRLASGRVGLDFLGRPDGHSRCTPGALERHPDLAHFFARAQGPVAVKATLWNSYPPYVSGRPGLVSVLHSYGWEETGYPQEYIRRFERCLDGITVMSSAVRKILIDNGTALPMAVSGLGVDHILQTPCVPYEGDLGEGFRFLYISSGFPRKGLDVLLDAYGRAFTGADDVTLVLKTFPNRHNRVEDLVRAFQENHADPPRVVVINRDLPDGMVRDLYRRCHAFVAPTRGEGFGLPMAEAMLHGLPVIVTEGSGQADFCTHETAWLIPARWARAASHLSEPGSLWLDPDRDALAKTMLAVASASSEELAPRCRAARHLVASQFTWDRWAQRTQQAVETFGTPSPWRYRPISMVWVSTWGGRCGIARYSQYLLTPLLDRPHAVRATVLAPAWESPLVPDPSFVRRAPHGPQVVEDVLDAVEETQPAVAVIQYHPAFFGADRLAALVDALHERGVLVWITFHAVRQTADALRENAAVLRRATRLAVHTLEDVNFFRSLGLDDRTVLWPHGVPTCEPQDLDAAKRRFGLEKKTVVATFGFLMPHKGVLPLLAAFQKLLGRFLNLFLVLATSSYPTEASARHADEVRQAIQAMGLERRTLFLTDFLEDRAALALLQAADLIVFPYQHTEESSSAAVRFGLAAGRPTACTPLGIFDDVASVVHFLPGTDPEALAQGIGDLLADPSKRHALQDQQTRWVARHAWPVVAHRMERVLRALLMNPDAARDGGVAGERPARGPDLRGNGAP